VTTPCVTLPLALVLRTLSALRSALTPAGHLAQRVTHEHLGYCAWNAESERCSEQRALIAELSLALEEPCDTSTSATV
jgi:hypothetical protein